MLVNVTLEYQRHYKTRANPRRKTAVRVLVSTERIVKTIWVTGLSTEGLADDVYKKDLLPGIFIIAGTKSYTTVNGAKRTVYLAKPVVSPPPDSSGK